MSKDKKKVEIEIYEDMDKLLDKIVDDYNLHDKSKAIRVFRGRDFSFELR